jgi:hypothetical protein
MKIILLTTLLTILVVVLFITLIVCVALFEWVLGLILIALMVTPIILVWSVIYMKLKWG